MSFLYLFWTLFCSPLHMYLKYRISNKLLVLIFLVAFFLFSLFSEKGSVYVCVFKMRKGWGGGGVIGQDIRLKSYYVYFLTLMIKPQKARKEQKRITVLFN